jgi:hypothetical protein
METWLPERVKTCVRALLDGAGQTSRAEREEILGRAAQPPGGAPGSLSPAIAEWVDRVAHRAYTIRDEDVAHLRDTGHDEDLIFEVTLAAALGAGLERLRTGLRLLRGEQ